MDETELDCYDWPTFVKIELLLAIIDSLYEPTERMFDSAESVVLTINKHEKIRLGADNIKKIWTAMLEGVTDGYV